MTTSFFINNKIFKHNKIVNFLVDECWFRQPTKVIVETERVIFG